ncbi:HAMP domain-containing sensor histidine kinase [Sphingomonas sp. KR3-1]|uniref:sensor histidine kinase n=1 Tax=Sphingomonas sp. KR3-1 TaxID=3156611 RepID=UPI0032B49F3A
MAEPVQRRRSALNSGAFRFALIFAAVFACASFLLLDQVYQQIGSYAEQATIGALKTETASLTAGNRADLPAEIRLRTAATPDGTFLYLLVDPHGRQLVGTIPMSAARPGQGRISMREPGRFEPEELATLGTRLPDGALLVVATDSFDIGWIRGQMIRFMIAWAVTVTLLALAAGWAAAWLFLKRLSAANSAIDRIMAGRTEQRIPMIGLAPELDDLARNLNRMLERIDGLMEGLRQVSTDVAHDLRTPLTRLRQMLEAAREAAQRDEAVSGIDAAIAQADQLLATFRAILRLAQIEGGGRRAPFESVDLGALLHGLVETYEPVAHDAEHVLTAPIAETAPISGDAELLAQLFANLIENAILHTPAGTQVRVDVEAVEEGFRASVIDNGAGVSAAERAHLTRRFYQVDPSRSAGSAGLGLAMVSAIAQLHGARLEIGDAGPGLRVSLVFARVR